jgi:hypothetical protein
MTLQVNEVTLADQSSTKPAVTMAERLQQYREEKKKSGYVFKTFCIHTSFLHELAATIKTRNKEVAARAYLASIPKML